MTTDIIVILSGDNQLQCRKLFERSKRNNLSRFRSTETQSNESSQHLSRALLSPPPDHMSFIMQLGNLKTKRILLESEEEIQPFIKAGQFYHLMVEGSMCANKRAEGTIYSFS